MVKYVLSPIPRHCMSEIIPHFHQSVSTAMRMSHIAAWLISAWVPTSWGGYEKRALRRKVGSSRGWNHQGWLSFRLIAVMSLGCSKRRYCPKTKLKRMSKQLLSANESQMIHSQNLFNQPSQIIIFSFTPVTAVSSGVMLTCYKALSHQTTPEICVYRII